MASSTTDHPDGIFSILDTDLYKLTMQCCIHKFFTNVQVSYKFTNRTPHMKLSRKAFDWLKSQIDKLANLYISDDEIAWLKKRCPFFDQQYLDYLSHFRLQPSKHVQATFSPADSSALDADAPGDVSIEVHGLWVDTILYEIPLLALTSESYFKFVDKDWNHDGQFASAKEKGLRLLESGCVFSEFGSRRRRDYRTQDIIMRALIEAQGEARNNGLGWKGQFNGTSNVHFAMRFDLNPIGTIAHEMFMGIAALTEDYANANERTMQYWIATYGRGTLAIALTDTFGTPAFLRAFSLPAPKSGTLDDVSGAGEPTHAQIWTGVRQDSGDPLEFVQTMRDFYQSVGITDKKTVVFSDSLNVEKCIKYKDAALAAGMTPSFGIGTFFTNDFQSLATHEKSVPLNIVIKLSEAKGHPAIKLSDDKGKNMGDGELMQSVKRQVGYSEKDWRGGDEAHRWDADGAE